MGARATEAPAPIGALKFEILYTFNILHPLLYTLILCNPFIYNSGGVNPRFVGETPLSDKSGNKVLTRK